MVVFLLVFFYPWYLLPLLWYCFFPCALLLLHKMLRLELSSYVGGEMMGVAAVFSAGLQFYADLLLPTPWLPADLRRCMEDICLQLNASVSKRVLVLCKRNLFLFVKWLCKLGN